MSNPHPTPPAAPPNPLQDAWRVRMEENELALQEVEAAARLAEEKTAQAKARVIKIYRDPHMEDGEKRTRMWSVLESYQFDADMLSPAIIDFLKEEYLDDNL